MIDTEKLQESTALDLFDLRKRLRDEISRRIEELRQAGDLGDERAFYRLRSEGIEDLDLSVRSYHALKRAGIDLTHDIALLADADYANIRNCGKRSKREIQERLLEVICENCEPKPDEGDRIMDNLDDLDGSLEDIMTHGKDSDYEYSIEQLLGNLDDPYEGSRLDDYSGAMGDGRAEKHDDPVAFSASKQLDGLIGLDKVKHTLRSIIDCCEANKRFPAPGQSAERPSYHMLFMGNPGTAKTTVARLAAQMLFEHGIIERPRLREVGRADLVGKYVGQTAPKVVRAFDAADGGVLFIDEAYSLVDGDAASFGDEAIATIVQEMENRRSSVVAIFAGYPDRMDGFLHSNDGLASRIKFVLDFDDYSEGEMLQIFEKLAAERGFRLAAGVTDTLAPAIRAELRSSVPQNGRWVRNALEQAELHWASRVMRQVEVEAADSDGANGFSDTADAAGIRVLEPSDFAGLRSTGQVLGEGRRQQIGFAA